MIEYLHVTVCYLCFNRTYAHVIVFIGVTRTFSYVSVCPPWYWYVTRMLLALLVWRFSHEPYHLPTFPEPEAG